ncbi:Chaperone protein HtpG [Astathelohania contejeani]|uniref:Chaperone protein HtpG n=1 Tax=Astathelohania contejeani TaxID=164912 RepID=A0ABQ7HWY0_9MICR|nr:Chaperone protein HtpG [Thelohania contejeani]
MRLFVILALATCEKLIENAMQHVADNPKHYTMSIDPQLINNITTRLLRSDSSFIKELISNSIDANTKLVMETGNEHADYNKHIRISLEGRTLIIEDQGVGMSDTEIRNFIGSLGGSGTRALNSNDLIGKFGMGFYSVFFVANRVVLETRRHDSTQGWRFTHSMNEIEYTLEPIEKEKHGTKVILSLKDEFMIDEKMIENWVNENILNDGSNTHYKIQLVVNEKEKEEEEKEGEEKISEVVDGVKTLKLTPWSDSNDEAILDPIFRDRFNKYAKLIACRKISFSISQKAEINVTTNFDALVFIPEIHDMKMFGMEEKGKMEVFVGGARVHDPHLEKIPELLKPMYFIIKSSDALLSSTREEFVKGTFPSFFNSLQSKIIEVIYSMIHDEKTRAKTIEGYESYIKKAFLEMKREGGASHKLQVKLAGIMPFETPTGFEILKNMEGKEIYYTTVPILLARLRNGIIHPMFDGIKESVFFCNGIVDEQVLSVLKDYEGRKIKNIAVGYKKEEKKEEEEKEAEKEENEVKEEEKIDEAFLSFIKDTLKSYVSDVVPSTRLTSHPFSLQVGENAMSSSFKSILGANSITNSPFRSIFDTKPVLEVNMASKELKKLEELSKSNEALCKSLLNQYLVATSLVCNIDLYDKVGGYFSIVNSIRRNLGMEEIIDIIEEEEIKEDESVKEDELSEEEIKEDELSEDEIKEEDNIKEEEIKEEEIKEEDNIKEEL